MRRLLPLLLAAPLLIAAAPASPLVVERPELRATTGTLKTTAAYFTLKNTGAAPDTLTGASCACAATAAVHESKMANGVMRMAPSGPLAVAPGGQIVLKPGGLHLMLTGLRQPIKAGQTVRITLVFAKAGKREIAFKASDTAGLAAPASGMDAMPNMHHGG